jgi:hypothetical protein
MEKKLIFKIIILIKTILKLEYYKIVFNNLQLAFLIKIINKLHNYKLVKMHINILLTKI